MVNTVEIEKKGFLYVDIDPSLDLFAEIEKLKKEKNAAKKIVPKQPASETKTVSQAAERQGEVSSAAKSSETRWRKSERRKPRSRRH